jgi:hypothetical protein
VDALDDAVAAEDEFRSGLRSHQAGAFGRAPERNLGKPQIGVARLG